MYMLAYGMQFAEGECSRVLRNNGQAYCDPDHPAGAKVPTVKVDGGASIRLL